MNLDSAIFYTKDLERIKKFYLETVGLTFDYQDGEKFVSFKFPNCAKLGIKLAGKKREVPGTQTVFLSTDDIDSEYKKYQDLGFEFYETLKEFSWGKYFAILDPDNNKISFVQRDKSV